jgi:hypothetical protein
MAIVKKMYKHSSRVTAKLGILYDSMILKETMEIERIENVIEQKERRNIHVVGNSHSHSFTGSNLSTYGRGEKEGIKWDSYNLGPLSSQDFLKYKLPLFDKVSRDNGFAQGDRILLTFGEAECRRYALRNVNRDSQDDFSDSELKEILEPFIRDAQVSIDQIEARKFLPIVWGGHAASWVDPKDQINMPTLGTPEIRNRLSRLWHNSMREFAKERGYAFFSMLPVTLRSDNSCDLDLLVDPVHLKFEAVAGYFLAFLDANSILKESSNG